MDNTYNFTDVSFLANGGTGGSSSDINLNGQGLLTGGILVSQASNTKWIIAGGGGTDSNTAGYISPSAAGGDIVIVQNGPQDLVFTALKIADFNNNTALPTNVIKSGSGNLDVDGPAGFSGNTYLIQGNIFLEPFVGGNNDVFHNSPIVFEGGNLGVTSSAASVGGFAGSANTILSSSGTVYLTPKSGTNPVYSGNFSGGGTAAAVNLVMDAPGASQTLSGQNFYVGNTTLIAGTLRYHQSRRLW